MYYNEKNKNMEVFMGLKLNDLSIDEKLLLLTGKDYWSTHSFDGKLSSVFFADGPNGLRTRDKETKNLKNATAMPNISALANTWNKELAYLTGSTIADECIESDVDVLLAPGVNIKRTPLNGRNFEYFSEDPYLAGTMAKEYINGVQDKGVGTSLKHYCANNREYDRFFQSNEIDDRALMEIYLKPFEIAIKAKPWTVMSSYNMVNGMWMSEHKKLLKGVLREKLGYKGLIMSDWESVHNRTNALKASLDLEMPFSEFSFEQLKTSYESGEITIEEIDYCVSNILNLINEKENAKDRIVEFSKEQRHQNAVEVAKEAIVLLKNEDDILPLTPQRKIVITGKYADDPTIVGGGSAYVQTDFVQPKLANLVSEKLGVSVESGNALCSGRYGSVEKSAFDFVRGARYDYEKIYNADVAVICVGENPPTVSENYDRQNMSLSAEQEDYILRATELNDNVVVVVYAGSAIDMSAWIDRVKAVVFVGFAGEGVNQALASILVGQTNPSGKLAESFPICLEDTFTGNYFGDKDVEWYNDGIFVGYRYYDKCEKDVQFAFGHGLSYSQFEYSGLKVEKIGKTEFNVSYDITNVSKIDGKEVSQIYVKEVLPFVTRPEKELKYYSKDLIKAGQTKRISLQLGFDAFAFYSTAHDDWHVNEGAFEIMVGASSRDIRLKEKIKITK